MDEDSRILLYTTTFLDYFSVFAHQAHQATYRAGPRDDFIEAQPPHLLPVQTLFLWAHVRAGSHEGLGVDAAKRLLAQLCEAHSFQNPGIRASSVTPSWPNCPLGTEQGVYNSRGCYLGQSVCTLHRLLACQVRVTVGDSGLCCCVYVMSFER